MRDVDISDLTMSVLCMTTGSESKTYLHEPHARLGCRVSVGIEHPSPQAHTQASNQQDNDDNDGYRSVGTLATFASLNTAGGCDERGGRKKTRREMKNKRKSKQKTKYQLKLFYEEGKKNIKSLIKYSIVNISKRRYKPKFVAIILEALFYIYIP